MDVELLFKWKKMCVKWTLMNLDCELEDFEFSEQ